MSNLVAHIDGGSLGNPGPSGIGVVIDGSGDEKIKIKKWIGHQDNNVAEYAALLEALQIALDLGARTLHVFSDSEVVVKQMTGEYACQSSRLYSLHWTCRKLARSLEFSISHIPRENNLEANRLGQFRRPTLGERKGFGHAYDRLNSHAKDDLCPQEFTLRLNRGTFDKLTVHSQSSTFFSFLED